MTLFHTGAKSCATAALMILLAGCGDQRSILAPTHARLATGLAAQPADTDVRPGPYDNPPALTLYNSDFRYTYRVGTYTLDPASWVRLEVAAGEPFTVNWSARVRGPAKIRAYRWTLDIEDIADETPRVNEATDLAHWSVRSLSTKSATVGPFAAGEQHLLYVDVEDSRGVKSLATVQLNVVESSSGR